MHCNVQRCGCDACTESRNEDSLRHSRRFFSQYCENKMMCDEITFLLILYVSRINAYRALASPSLISLSSKVRI